MPARERCHETTAVSVSTPSRVDDVDPASREAIHTIGCDQNRAIRAVLEDARPGAEVERWNRLHPGEDARLSHVERCLSGRKGPVVAASDYVRSHVEPIRAHVPGRFSVLGTDGYGRSDGREKLRSFFEVDRYFVVVNALKALADEGLVDVALVSKALSDFGIKSNRPDPMVS